MSVEPRAIARTVLGAALAAVAPDEAVRRHVRRDGRWLRVDGESYDLAAYRRVVAVGAGKASGLMAQSVEALLGDRLAGGLGADDLLLLLLSGGGSALLERPAPGLDLDALQTTTDLLLRAGASIGELN